MSSPIADPVSADTTMLEAPVADADEAVDTAAVDDATTPAEVAAAAAVAAATAAAAAVEAAAEEAPVAVPAAVAITSAVLPREYGTITAVGDNDVLLGEGAADNYYKMNLFLQDWIHLQRIIWKLQDKAPPTQDEHVQDLVNEIIKTIQQGKPCIMAGLNDVPKPALQAKGRFLKATSAPGDAHVAYKVMDDDQVKQVLIELLLAEFQKDEIEGSPILTDSPYKELKEMLYRTNNPANAAVAPEPADAILFQVVEGSSPWGGAGDKLYEQQMGNRAVFNMASQLVTTFTTCPSKRVEAALFLLQGLDDAEILSTNPSTAMAAAPGTTTRARARFLLRHVHPSDESISWSVLTAIEAAEFALTFVFEVYLEKALDLRQGGGAGGAIDGGTTPYAAAAAAAEAQLAGIVVDSTVPIDNPVDADVLFGRGGMTNSHPGNRRFRDIIALHRPDYIRAIKMDKPLVARKIVRAIRYGPRPGRFLKKQPDGHWYDVGDRTAAEKTSQGLRERTNAEKRQRSALREALRIRRQDMTEDSDASNPSPQAKRVKTEAASAYAAVVAPVAVSNPTPMPILNYVGTNVAVPLSLGMKEDPSRHQVKRKKEASSNGGIEELNTEGLPPNAVDEFGEILVTDYDILCGRGGLTNHHKGNKRFRDVVALHRPDYVRAPKIQKPSVARVIVRAIRNGDPPGRFLRKDEKTGRWVDIGDKKAAEKTSQALREKTNDDNDKVKHNPDETAAVLLPGATSYSTATTVAAPLGVGVGGVHVASPILIDHSLPAAPPATQESGKAAEELQEMAAAAAQVVAAASATATATSVTESGQDENKEETAKPPAAEAVQTQQAEAAAAEDQSKTQAPVQGNEEGTPVPAETTAGAEVAAEHHAESSVQAEVLDIPEPTKIDAANEHGAESEHVNEAAQAQQETEEADPTEDNASSEPTAEEIQEALQQDDI